MPKEHELSLTDAVLPRTDPFVVGRIYQTLEILDRLLTKHQITYWIGCGTFLGAIRHNGLIPWDDDADIHIVNEDMPRIWGLQPELSGYGYGLGRWWGGYKLFPLDGQDMRPAYRKLPLLSSLLYEEPAKYPFIDIMPVRCKQTRYVLASFLARIEWPKAFFEQHELFPLVTRPFGFLQLPAPKEYAAYFVRLFGKDWNEVAYREYDHVHSQSVKRQRVRLIDRSPAVYRFSNRAENTGWPDRCENR